MKNAHFLFFFLMTCLRINSTKAQCSNTIMFPLDELTASVYNDTVSISDMSSTGEFAIVNGLTLFETYVFASDNEDDYITLRNANDNVLLAHGPTPLSYTPSTVDIVAVHFNLSVPLCGIALGSRATYLVCTSCEDVAPLVQVGSEMSSSSLEVYGEIKIGEVQRTAVAGMIRWNSGNKDFEGYNGDKWVSLTKSSEMGKWGSVSTRDIVPDEQISSSDGEAGDRFGASVSIDGDYAVIGSQFSNIDGVPFQGAAYIYHKEDNGWIEQQKLFSNDGSSLSYFGSSVGISGDYVIVGSRGDDIDGNTDQGAAYIYHRSGTSWILQTKLIATDGESLDLFGSTVSIDGEFAAVGSYLRDVDGNVDEGCVYIFERSGSTWTEQTKLTASDGEAGDRFGQAVSIDGNYIVIGSYWDQVGSNINQGSAYVFLRSGTVWSEQAKLIADDGMAADLYGYAVDIDGDYIIIGSFNDDINNTNQGSAYIYHRLGTVWSQQAQIVATDSAVNDRFGNAVSISNEYALVGASNADVSGIVNEGKAYIFKRNEDSWIQESKITKFTGDANAEFGISVSLSGDEALIGAYKDRVGNATGQGSVYFIGRN